MSVTDSDGYSVEGRRDRYSLDDLDNPRRESWRNCWGAPIGPYLAFVLLGIAPQLIQNMIFSEAPLLAAEMPEGRAMQAHIIAAFMVANAITLLYLLLQFFFRISDLVALVVILAAGVFDSILLACFWDATVYLGKHKVSVVLMIGSFIAGAAGNTSTLISFSFASRYKEVFVSALSAGFGMSGLIPSLLNFAQNTGADWPFRPNFGPTIWFLSGGYLIVMFSLSLVYIMSQRDIKDPEQVRHTHEQKNKLMPGHSAINEVDVPTKTSAKVVRIGESLAMMLVTSVSTFLIPGSLPYMGESQAQLVWMNIIFLVIPTVGTAGAALWRPFKRSRIVPWACLVLQSIVFAYLFLTVMKHSRPYVYHGLPVLFIALILFAILSGYNSTMVYLILRQEEVVNVALVEQAQRWAGFAFQVGGFVGIFSNLGLLHSRLYFGS